MRISDWSSDVCSSYRGGFECGGLYVDHDDCHAPLYERTADPKPDPRCATCNDSDSVPEIFHHPLHVPELTEGQGAVADATTLQYMCTLWKRPNSSDLRPPLVHTTSHL